MGTDESPPRSRAMVIAGGVVVLLVLLVGAASIARDDDSGESPEDSTAAIVLDEVDTESITVTNSSTSAITRHGDDILIVDGIATSGELDPWEPGAEPSTRVWVVDGDNPSTAQPYDLPMVGPRLYPEVWWWDGQWALLGERCPEPWDPADVAAEYAENSDAYEPETCGSYTADLFVFDPDAGSVRQVGAPFVGTDVAGGRERLQPIAVNGDTTVLEWATVTDLISVSLDGTLTDIDDLPGRRSHILPASDSFVALQVTSRGDSQGPTRDAAEFYDLLRLDSSTWVDEPLPNADLPRRWSDGGAKGDGFVFAGGDLGAVRGDGPPPFDPGYLLFTADPTTGETGWELVPTADTGSLAYTVDADAVQDWSNLAFLELARDPGSSKVTTEAPPTIGFERVDPEAWWGPLQVTVDRD